MRTELEMMTDNDLQRIREELNRLVTLTAAWSARQQISQLERDLVLDKLREVYDMVRFSEAMHAVEQPVALEQPVVADEPLSIDLNEVLSLGLVSDADTTASDADPIPEPQAEAAPQTVLEPESVVEISSEPESEAVPQTIPEPEPVVAPQTIPEPVVEISSEQATSTVVSEPEAAALTPDPSSATLFELEDDSERHRRKQRVIMSLYGNRESAPVSKTETTPTPKPTASAVVKASEPEADSDEDFEEFSVKTVQTTAVSTPATAPVDETFEPEPPVESVPDPDSDNDSPLLEEDSSDKSAVLGDLINHRVQTLADTFTPRRDTLSEVVHHAPVKDLRAAIGINDRFQLVRDLFNSDAQACDAALDALNGFDNLDDCMIYIAENYTWNSNSDGAVLLMELLERKYA